MKTAETQKQIRNSSKFFIYSARVETVWFRRSLWTVTCCICKERHRTLDMSLAGGKFMVNENSSAQVKEVFYDAKHLADVSFKQC